MPIFDTPIHVNDANWSKILQQKQPVLVYLFNQPNARVDEELQRLARNYAGELLITRVNTKDNPKTYAQYHTPDLPALLTIKAGKQQSLATAVQVSELESHAKYVLGRGPKPVEKPVSNVATPVTVTDQTFYRTVLQSEVPVLVDFWAPWCGPCHVVAPIVDAVAKKYSGRIKVAKVNVDENPQLASTYQTMSIPTLILFRQNQVAGRLVGVQPQSVIESLIEQNLRV